jgi:hypothetical protein
VQAPDDGALMASYSVFVVEPGSLPGTNPSFVYQSPRVTCAYLESIECFFRWAGFAVV